MSTRLTVEQIIATLAVTQAAQTGRLLWPIQAPPTTKKARRR
jgi:hypothetical protein